MDRIFFGNFVLALGTRELLTYSKSTPLRGRAFDLLLYFLQNSGRVLSKKELMEAVWGSRVVIDNNLNAQISALRKMIGNSALVSVSGQGFRLTLEVERIETINHGLPTSLNHEASIAVLPFENMSEDPSQNYFANGISDCILTSLSNFKQLRVASGLFGLSRKNQTIDVQQTGCEMGFDYVLTGSVQRSGQQLRVTAKLTEVSEGAQLWSQHFDGNLADVFSMQDHITSQVVSVVEPVIRMKESALALRRHPASSDAYDFYLRALPYVIAFNPSANVTALGYLNQALALDSEYLPALVNAAWCYEQRLIRHWSIANESQRSKAISLARRALVKPSNDARSIALAGYVLFMAGHLHEDGLGVLQRAASLNPNDVTVLSLAGIGHLFLGDIDTAEPYLERAMLLSNAAPDAFMPMTSLAALQFFRGNYTAALKLANKSVASNPNWDFSWWVIIAAAAETGNQSRVNEAIESLERFAPDFDQAQLIWEIFINVDHRLLWTNSLLKAKALHAKRE